MGGFFGVGGVGGGGDFFGVGGGDGGGFFGDWRVGGGHQVPGTKKQSWGPPVFFIAKKHPETANWMVSSGCRNDCG